MPRWIIYVTKESETVYFHTNIRNHPVCTARKFQRVIDPVASIRKSKIGFNVG